jgi:hypothetical protein
VGNAAQFRAIALAIWRGSRAVALQRAVLFLVQYPSNNLFNANIQVKKNHLKKSGEWNVIKTP